MTRDALIDATIRVVASAGLESASVKTIAAEAGVVPGLLHYHFRDKDELLEAALRRAFAEYQDRLASRRAGGEGLGQLNALLADGREALTRDADLFRVRLSFAVRALSSPRVAAVVRDLSAAGARETALTLASADGREDLEARDLARATVLKAAFEGVMLASLIDPEFPLDEAERVFLSILTRGTRSLRQAHGYPRALDFMFRRILPLVVRDERVSTAAISGALLADLATGPAHACTRGGYYSVRGRRLVSAHPSALARDDGACAALWEESAALVAAYMPAV